MILVEGLMMKCWLYCEFVFVVELEMLCVLYFDL